MGFFNLRLNLPRLRYKLFPHQEYAFAFAMRNKYSINGYEVGQGKTAVAIAVAEAKQNKKLKTLIICPAFLKKNWISEIKKFAHSNPKVREINAAAADVITSFEERYAVINYEILHRLPVKFWNDVGFLVCDESQYLGNSETLRTSYLFKILEDPKTRPERLLLMSGTPIRGKLDQWYAPLYLCRHESNDISLHHFLENLWSFRNYFMHRKVVHYSGMSRVTFTGVQRASELIPIIRKVFLRKDPDFEVVLPPISFEEISIDKTNIVDEDGMEIAYERYRESPTLTEAVSSVKKNNAIMKVEATIDLILRLLKNGVTRIVVFSDHIEPARLIFENVLKKKIEATLTTSLIAMPIRHSNILKFQRQSRKNPIVYVSTIGSGSTGITLTAASCLIFNDRSWTQTDNDQAIGRIYRVTQEQPCKIYDILNGKMDKKIKKITEEKRKINEMTVEI